MATFGEFLRAERGKKGLNQSEFGQFFGIIMTEISKIENGKKKFPFDKLVELSKFIGVDYLKLKNLYVADKIVEDVYKYECSEEVFAFAENQLKYLKNKNVKQEKLKF